MTPGLDVVVLQHIACEPPGAYEDVLLDRGASIERIELDEGEQLPERRDFDALIAMGGPMSVNDEAAYPWLGAEKRFVAEVVRAGTPFWGVCLGVQLLAASLGARVYQGPEPEVGLLPVELTAGGRTDAVFADLADGLVTLQWHGDTFDLPDGAIRLAGSPLPEPGFPVPRRLRRPVPPRGYTGDGSPMGGCSRVRGVARGDTWAGIGDWLPREHRSAGAEMLDHGRGLFERWLDRVVSPEPART